MAIKQKQKNVQQWWPGSSGPRTQLPAFTMIEALIALAVTVLVLMSLQMVAQQLQHSSQKNPQINLQVALNQLNLQHYQIERVNQGEILVKNSTGESASLKVMKHRLVVVSPQAGQVILMHDVDAVTCLAQSGYQILRLKLNNGRIIEGSLFLPNQSIKDNYHHDK
ncbi:competence protein ComGF [Leuconostocaceae bacterium R-53105]|uniref:Competence protein ComGF n=2 Tax=Convivina intestini TaxID=1505726 RepID=A0A2U1D5V9_9LACO|nr:competence protein ComGF [Convivina intestini]CAH1856469.1 hypothetical protein R077811_01259 [Convivina intestini]SDB98954.1 competence protein ComGF [Leuconostocaceae bacterium R-53105]